MCATFCPTPTSPRCRFHPDRHCPVHGSGVELRHRCLRVSPTPAPPDFRRRRLVVGVAPPIGDVVVAPKSSSSRPPRGIQNASQHTSSAASSAAAPAASAAALPASTKPVCCHRRCTSGACDSSYAPLLLLLRRGLATPRVGWFHATSTGASVSSVEHCWLDDAVCCGPCPAP